jgi:hypothetical protein
MTSNNNRAKKDARERRRATGESYTTARRRTRKVRLFIPDHCANCLQKLPDIEEKLFCSELCSETAKAVRYGRRIHRDGRIDQRDVQEALHIRMAFLLGGGYHRQARALPMNTRRLVWERDAGRCCICNQPGEEIDHVNGDSPELDNLQLLCKGCHHAKTRERMVVADPDQQLEIRQLFTARVAPNEPALLCDDEQRWQKEWRSLKKERRERLLAEMKEAGLDLAEFRGAIREEMCDALDDSLSDAYDDGGWSEDDDSGYGPFSYFARAMAKND